MEKGKACGNAEYLEFSVNDVSDPCLGRQQSSAVDSQFLKEKWFNAVKY